MNSYLAHRNKVRNTLNLKNYGLLKVHVEKVHCLKCNDNFTINEFLSTFYNHNMFPLIDRPTRITPHSATLIDNIFCNVFNNKIKSGAVIAGLTDHFPIFQITSSVFRHDNNVFNNRRSRLFNKTRLQQFCYDIGLVNWDFVSNFDSPNDAYNSFIQKFMHIYNIHFPYKLSRINKRRRNIPRKPWITSAIVKSINRKDKLYKKYVSHSTDYNKNLYVTYRNRLTALIRVSKRNYYADKLKEFKHNSKQTWNVLNNILGRNNKPTIASQFKLNNIQVSDPTLIANGFNSYFVNVGSNLAREIPPADINFQDFLQHASSPLNSLFFISYRL